MQLRKKNLKGVIVPPNFMKAKHLTMTIDNENGIKFITLLNNEAKKTISVADDGAEFLNKLGGDVVLHFDEQNRLVSIELMGLE